VRDLTILAVFALAEFLSGYEVEFALRLGAALVAGLLIGLERELKGKPAGISTHAFVIGGASLFAYASTLIEPAAPARMAGQIVTGVGFLGAGIILRNEVNGRIGNVTTAASIWYSAAIGVVIGLGWFVVAAMATAYALVVARIPRIDRSAGERGA
jgi:putative Mg2+ transporter-C (MgtC) family protein